MKYFYYINLDERGEFKADVRNDKGETIFEIEGAEIFEDGFMKYKNDLAGLEVYLKELKVMHPAGMLFNANMVDVFI